MSTILRGNDGFDSYSSIRGFKNLIINGRKQVNQSGLTVTDNAYNYDNHYKVGNNWFMFIDGKNIISGEAYTLSWDGAATASWYIGTSGSSTINAQSFTAIANGETITPNIASNQLLWIKFASDASGSTYNKVQFEPGVVATPYEQRLYELEESLVQRFFRIDTSAYRETYARNNMDIYSVSSFSKMRTTPIVILSVLINDANRLDTVTINYISDDTIIVSALVVGATGDPVYLLYSYTLSARP